MLERLQFEAPQEITVETMDTLRMRMSVLQQKARSLGIPAVIVFEGFDAAGKGEAISDLIDSLDPRGFKVRTMGAPNEVDRRCPPMNRYQVLTPANGQIVIFNGSWYREVSAACFEEKVGKDELAARFERIADLEGKLATSGALIVKLFLSIGKKEQKRRLNKLEEDKATSWRVTKADWQQNKDYDEYYQVFDAMMERTDFPFARWEPLNAENKDGLARQVYNIVIAAFEQATAEKQRLTELNDQPAYDFVPYVKPIVPAPIARLADVALNVRLQERQDYRELLRDAHKRLRALQNRLFKKRIPMVLAFEGWDAAGKGGSILRLTQALDPRGFEVNPTSAPDATEKSHHYLWRFWNHVPEAGHIAIFDRSWYGRVMVERVEGFCQEGDWRRAYDEINHFEKALADWGAVVIKFWLQIDQDEQLRRFNDRQTTPEKQYKITDEDWRNRKKWPEYELAVDEMLQKTNTDFAPWVVVESNDKHYGRLKVVNTVIDAVEQRLMKK